MLGVLDSLREHIRFPPSPPEHLGNSPRSPTSRSWFPCDQAPHSRQPHRVNATRRFASAQSDADGRTRRHAKSAISLGWRWAPLGLGGDQITQRVSTREVGGDDVRWRDGQGRPTLGRIACMYAIGVGGGLLHVTEWHSASRTAVMKA